MVASRTLHPIVEGEGWSCTMRRRKECFLTFRGRYYVNSVLKSRLHWLWKGVWKDILLLLHWLTNLEAFFFSPSVSVLHIQSPLCPLNYWIYVVCLLSLVCFYLCHAIPRTSFFGSVKAKYGTIGLIQAHKNVLTFIFLPKKSGWCSYICKVSKI